MNSPVRELTMLLGADHPAFGAVEMRVQAEGRSALAISAGAAGPSGAEARKQGVAVPNEDAVLVVDEGPRTLLAVADSHHGHEAACDLVAQLAQRFAPAAGAPGPAPLPRDPLAVLDVLRRLDRGSERPDTASRAALLVAVIDRERGQGFGASFGDCSLTVVGRNREPMPVTRKNRAFVSPWLPGSLHPRLAFEFALRVQPGDLVLAFTDGIDECHYGNPQASIRPAHIWNLLLESGSEPLAYARGLAELALAGVGGNAGGQDNLAIGVSRA